MAIKTNMSGREVDRVLKAINDAENTDNNGLIIFIRNGQLAFDTEQNLFNVAELE